MKFWVDSILGRGPQIPQSQRETKATFAPEQVLGWIAEAIESDRLWLSDEAKKALARVNGAVAQQDRRKR